MKKGILFSLLVISVVCLAGCKPDLGKYAGNYRFVKKIDEADKSETVYKKGEPRFQKGYLVSVSGDNLQATPSHISDNGKAEKSSMGTTFILKRTDEGIFQYKKEDGSLVLTFIFSDTGLRIDEYAKDKYGNLKKESQLELSR